MKQIGIITYHNADNLGAVLQAYALQTILQNNCCVHAEIIDYRCDAIEATKFVAYEKWLKVNVKAIAKSAYYCIKRRGFDKFRKKYLKRSEEVYTPQSVRMKLPDYDAYITGSDQVWNPECSGWDDTYFLNFVPEGRKKYAYAASLGTFRFPAECSDHYRMLLKDFSLISVRETSAIAEMEQLGIQDVMVCPDPVVLLEKEQWQKIMPKRLCRQRYVLVYLVLPDREVSKQAEHYAKENNCKVIHNKKSLEFILHNSPAEFLSWVYYAECVFTNSFHGTAFSLIFDKPLAADVLMTDGDINNRVQEILLAAGAEHCAMTEENSIPRAANTGSTLTRMRSDGLAYLKELCEAI